MLRSGEILDMREMHEEGLSITEIARRTGRDRKTIRKRVQAKGLPKPQKRETTSILDPFTPFIQEQMRKGSRTLRRCSGCSSSVGTRARSGLCGHSCRRCGPWLSPWPPSGRRQSPAGRPTLNLKPR